MHRVTMISLFLVRRLRSRWRHLLWLYPLAMAFALVYTGEHYVADIVAGWIYCVVVYVAIGALGALGAARLLRGVCPLHLAEPARLAVGLAWTRRSCDQCPLPARSRPHWPAPRDQCGPSPPNWCGAWGWS